MTTTNFVTRVVNLSVVGIETHKGKQVIKIDVPAWDSQYPTVLYNQKQEALDALPMGFAGTVELTGKLKDGNDGSKPWHYFWDFVRVAIGEEAPASGGGAVNSQRPPAQRQQAAGSDRMDLANHIRQTSIERQTSLKAAVDFYTSDTSGMATPELVLETAETFLAWLSRPIEPPAATAPAPSAAPTVASGPAQGTGTRQRETAPGQQCPVHQRPWGIGPEERVGHPIPDGGGWCWQDELQEAANG